MRRTARLVTVASFALAAVVVPLPAQADTGGQVVVPSTGQTVYTSFLTAVGREYEITVTGTYDYNGWGNLADCGHFNPENAGSLWTGLGNLRIDETVAACAGQPYTPTHTYTWRQPGTGAPYAFRIEDAFYFDNRGSLYVDIVLVGGPYEVDATCEAVSLDDSELDQRVLAVAVHAAASNGEGPPPLVSAECAIRDGSTVVATVSTAAPGPVTAGGRVVVLPPRTYEACLSVTVTYLDGSTWFLSHPCRTV